MKISITATTRMARNIEDIASKEEFDEFGGKNAGICYMAHSFADLLTNLLRKPHAV